MPKIVFEDSFWEKIAAVAIVLAAAALVIWVLIIINRLVFKTLTKKQRGIHLVFFEKLNKGIIVIAVLVLAISVLDSGTSAWKTMLGGTAVVSAVIAFTAQDVIKDLLAGLMISLQKPFEIGDRIELEGGVFGVVSDITNRHVVLKGMDTVTYVVPNSRINAMMLTNYCFHRNCRSASFSFSIGYGSDLELARSVIEQAVRDCPHTIPGLEDKEGGKQYGKVYFTSFADSALIMKTTIYYENSTPSEVLVDEVNTRVREALNANGVEIPYNYINVVQAGTNE